MRFVFLLFCYWGLTNACLNTAPPKLYGRASDFADQPVWEEHFNKDGQPDTAIWSYDIGDNGWGNNELQYYTDAITNAVIRNGMLHIIALKEQRGKSRYTSARLVTRHKKDFLYGRIEVKAKLPAGVGTWPAIWMLPTDWSYGGWLQSGEIDIMEHVGKDEGMVHFSVHTAAYNHIQGTQKTTQQKVSNATSDFHLYRVDWTPDYIKGFFDDREVFSFENDHKGDYNTWPFDKKFYLLLNIAIGGNWGGPDVDEHIFPAAMVIDYIKYYPFIGKSE